MIFTAENNKNYWNHYGVWLFSTHRTPGIHPNAHAPYTLYKNCFAHPIRIVCAHPHSVWVCSAQQHKYSGFYQKVYQLTDLFRGAKWCIATPLWEVVTSKYPDPCLILNSSEMSAWLKIDNFGGMILASPTNSSSSTSEVLWLTK